MAMLDLPLLFHMLLGPAHHLTPPSSGRSLLESLLSYACPLCMGRAINRENVFAALQIVLQLLPERGWLRETTSVQIYCLEINL